MPRVSTTFKVKQVDAHASRTGEIRFKKTGVVKTPVLFPALNIMTGPPPPHRNGAHYKFIKRYLVGVRGHNHILSQVLHFTDYNFSVNQLNRWLEKPFQGWFDEWLATEYSKEEDPYNPAFYDNQRISEKKQNPYPICFFLDSGGFRLLFNSDFNIEKYEGRKSEAKDIFELQMAMGGDIIATLDHPIHDAMEEAEISLRRQQSIQKAIECLKLASEQSQYKPLVYLAIHGTTPEMAKEYVGRLIDAIAKTGVQYTNFGFAVGSLVPLRMHGGYVRIVQVIKSIKRAILEYGGFEFEKKPIHVFGVSGDMMPILALLGVDTFDSNSFVQGATKGKYLNHVTWKMEDFRHARGIECDCSACVYYRDKFALSHKKYMRQFIGLLDSPSGKTDIFIAGQPTIKSEVYAYLALHNLELHERIIDKVQNHIQHGTIEQYVIEFAKDHPNALKLFRAYAGDLDVAQYLPKRKISQRRREEFSVPGSYEVPVEKEILLLLACTKEKPYSTARSHQIINGLFHDDKRVHVVTISGLYGPVPREFETYQEVIDYDYVLAPSAEEQKDFVEKRLLDYLQRYGGHYRAVLAYVTSRAYREVVEDIFKSYERGILLPRKPRERTSKELLRRENLQELVLGLESYLGSFSKQLKMDLAV